MGRLIDTCALAGTLAFDVSYSKGSLLDRVANNTGTVVASPQWRTTRYGKSGLYFPAASAVYYADSAARQMIGGACTWVLTGDFTQNANARYIDKAPGYQILVVAAGIYLYVNAVYSYIAVNLTNVQQIAFTLVAGQKPLFYANGMLVGQMDTAVTPVAGGNALVIGSNAGYANSSLSAFSHVTMISRVLSGAEVATLYDEWLQEGVVKDLARRNFAYVYPAKRASEYAAAGIVLDTDFQRRSDGKVRDLTGNYPGTLVGVPVPAPNEEGLTQTINDMVDLGNVTQLNNAATFTMMDWITWGTTLVSSAYVYTKYVDANNNFLMTVSNTATSSKVAVWLSNGATATGTTTAVQLRALCKQHVAVVFDGAGATDADRLKVYIDGELVALTFTGAAIPATMANLAAANLKTGIAAGFNEPCTHHSMRTLVPSLTAAQIRAEYLKTGAQKLTLRETLEDVPVTLAASVAAPGQIGPWTLYGDSWANVESTTGRRSMKHIGAGHGAASRPSTDAFGTWHFFMRVNPTSVLEQYVLFIASQPGAYNAAGQNGYMVYLSGGQPWLFRFNGAVAASLAVGPVGSIVVGTEYEVIVNRRPSDCRFTIWMRGGAWGSTWTQVMQTADATHVTSAWISLGSVTYQDSFPMFDPFDATV